MINGISSVLGSNQRQKITVTHLLFIDQFTQKSRMLNEKYSGIINMFLLQMFWVIVTSSFLNVHI